MNNTPTNEELLSRIKDIQGHCFHRDDERCWYAEQYEKLRKEEWDSDVADSRLSDLQDEALIALIHTTVAKETLKARIEEVEKALEAGHGNSWDEQMAGTCGHVGNRYQELKKLANTKEGVENE